MMKKAVLLTFANSAIRSTVLAGDHETGKATCFMSASKLLPREIPVVEMPLNVTRARLFGSKGAKGLVDAASGGYLVVERINLFDDETVKKIVSLTEEKKYTLLATANMEDGPLPPGFGEWVDMLVMVQSITDIEERIEILKRLELYRGDMKGFYGMYSASENRLAERLRRARKIVESLELPRETVKRIEAVCKKRKKQDRSRSLGLAAASNAALDGRTWADTRDVEDAVPLVLGG